LDVDDGRLLAPAPKRTKNKNGNKSPPSAVEELFPSKLYRMLM